MSDRLNSVWERIANGMHGGIIMHSHNHNPAKEFYVIFGEMYNTAPMVNRSSALRAQ